jgi:hypothetical protein
VPITGPSPCPLPTRTVAALAHVGNIVRIDLLDAVEVLGEVARDLDPSPERRTPCRRRERSRVDDLVRVFRLGAIGASFRPG